MKSRMQDLVTQKIEFEDDNFRIYVKEHSNEVVEKAYHEEIEIKYHYEESALSIGSEIILAKSGDVTVANPYEVHSNISINQSHGKYCVVILDLDFLSGTNRDGIDLRRILIGNERKICNHIVSNERLGAIIRTIEAEMREKRSPGGGGRKITLRGRGRRERDHQEHRIPRSSRPHRAARTEGREKKGAPPVGRPYQTTKGFLYARSV